MLTRKPPVRYQLTHANVRALWGASVPPTPGTPQHAASHSASVGNLRPAQLQYASASNQVT